MRFTAATCLALLLSGPAIAAGAEPKHSSDLVFPLEHKHNHGSGIVECPNGDLLVSWYRGSGERSADDVAVYGARKKAGSDKWSDVFVMSDYKGFPDCNTTMMIDRHQRLWLFWPTVLNNQWDTVITNAQMSKDYTGEGTPRWDFHTNILLRPADFSERFLNYLDTKLPNLDGVSEKSRGFLQKARDEVNNKLYQSISWQPRCKPITLPSGRILFGLYSDTYSFSIVAISDDDGKSWYASGPIMGYGPVQPSLIRRNDGTICAYMRQNGYGARRIQYAESHDDGLTWTDATDSDLLNPGGGIDVVRLENGHWVMIFNDSERGRNNLAAALSEDEGKTWKYKRRLEPETGDSGSFAYPCVIQGKDGTIHTIYTFNQGEAGECMKHAAINEEWIKAKN